MSLLCKIAYCTFVCATVVVAQVPESINGVQSTGKFYATEWNTVMMESTYRIEGSTSKVGEATVGTAFILGSPTSPTDKNNHTSKAIIVTAEHVLAGMTGDFATLDMRIFDGGKWIETPIPLRIRVKGIPLWVHHPIADVAVMILQDARIESHIIQPLVPVDWLATDVLLKDYQIHPGDQVTCLGYPDALSSQFGFPILRVARIASFPIIPTVSSRPLYLDFPVYGGNSGGPAYLADTGTRGSALGGILNHIYILGLVIQKQYGVPSAQAAVSQGTTQPSDSLLADMHLAVLEPASVIRETVEMLPK